MVDFDEWVAARGDALFRLAYLLTGNRADAGDVVHDALARALPRWSRVRESEDPDAYVWRSVVTSLTSRWQRHRRGRAPVAEVRLGPSADPDVAEQDRVWRACLALPAEQRVAIVLRHHEHRDDADIAERSGVGVGTVQTRVSHALAALRAALDDDADSRLAPALAGVAERSPHPGDLAAGARARLRRRRRTTATVVATALAVVAIPVGLTATGADRARPDRHETHDEHVPADWRAESWHDLTLWVPPSWSWGTGTDWCARDESAVTATPVVSRPDNPERDLCCAPSYCFVVHFFAPS